MEMKSGTGYWVAVEKVISPDLQKEGQAREIVHRLQTMRKAAGFDIADHIVTYYQAQAELREVLLSYGPYIKQETLSRELVEAPPPPGAYQEKQRIDGHPLQVGVQKVD